LNPKFLLEEVRHVGFFKEETFAAMLDGSPKVFHRRFFFSQKSAPAETGTRLLDRFLAGTKPTFKGQPALNGPAS